MQEKSGPSSVEEECRRIDSKQVRRDLDAKHLSLSEACRASTGAEKRRACRKIEVIQTQNMVTIW